MKKSELRQIIKEEIKRVLNENDEAQRNTLLAKLKGQHAKDVVKDGKFIRVSQFGSGYDESPRVNVMDELRDELSYFKTPEDKDSDDYDDLMLDLKAAKEIAQVVAKMGGRVSYFSRSERDDLDDLKFIYSVDDEGNLFGQTEIVKKFNFMKGGDPFSPNPDFRPGGVHAD